MKSFRIGTFLLRLAVLLPVMVAAGWLATPYYVWIIGNLTAATFNFLVLNPIQGVRIEVAPEAVLRSSVHLVYVTKEGAYPMNAGALTGNLAPYLAMVLATPGITGRWRWRALWRGTLALVVTHMALIFGLFAIRDRVAETIEIASGVSVFLLTLPFVLWIALASWEVLWVRTAPSGPQSDTAE
jgi:hypothetical protein